MNLNPFAYLKSRRAKASEGSAILASTVEVESLGPFQNALGGYVPRKVNPWLYEAIREAVPLIDGAIGTLVTMDGIVRVKGGNEQLVKEITDWMTNVQAADLQRGVQAVYASQSNEAYEQGFGIVEWMPSADGRDIASLRVADSKGVIFARSGDGTLQVWYRAPAKLTGQIADGSDSVEALLRGTAGLQAAVLESKGYVQLDPARLLYVVNEPEADNPYGTSKIRSLEFPAQIVVKIINAIGRSWERYGDPPLHLDYKTKNPKVDATKLAERKTMLAAALADALAPKARGNSADLVTASGIHDEIKITTIGANGIALDPDKPMSELKAQIVAKFGTPEWLLGLSGGSGSGQAERQSEMVLQSSRTRFELRKPGLTHLVATMLRMRGRTWKPGDWELEQELPSLQDMMKIAQANFLNAQAQMVGQGNNTPAPQGIDNNLRTPRRQRTGGAKASSSDDDDGEPWAENDPKLPRIERRYIAAQLANWRGLAGEALAKLGFRLQNGAVSPVDVEAEIWNFDPTTLGSLLQLGERFTRENSGDDAPVLRATWEAWVRGWANASDELDTDTAIESVEALVRDQLLSRGGELVRSAVGRAYRERVIEYLTSGVYDGMNPVTVAASLKRKFDAGDYDWERLVRSEMAIAQSRGKLELYKANGYERYDYTTADDDLVSEICRSLADGGPYTVGDPSAPIPVVSSHPNCRCTIAPHVE